MIRIYVGALLAARTAYTFAVRGALAGSFEAACSVVAIGVLQLVAVALRAAWRTARSGAKGAA